MRIAFLGTPEFALPSLGALVGAGHEITVFTQPDKPVGRHGTLTPPPVKRYALEHGLIVHQPARIRFEEGPALLRSANPELMVTAAFGQILSKENLEAPKLGCINVHASLLPKYRGAAPVQWAIVNGERVTGVTTMMTDVGLDTGDILLKRETEILPDETAGELMDRLAKLGAEVLMDTLVALLDGTLTRARQDDREATRCPILKKEHGRVDFGLSSRRVHDLVRGMNPWPGAYALLEGGDTIKFYRTRVADAKPSGLAGSVVVADPKEGLFVNTGDGRIEILELQAPGGKRIDAKAFLRGRPLGERRFL